MFVSIIDLTRTGWPMASGVYAPLSTGHASFLPPARPMQHPARFRSGVLPVAQHLFPVHKHMHHSSGILVRFVVSGMVPDPGRIENHHVGEEAGPERPSAVKLERFGRQR